MTLLWLPDLLERVLVPGLIVLIPGVLWSVSIAPEGEGYVGRVLLMSAVFSGLFVYVSLGFLAWIQEVTRPLFYVAIVTFSLAPLVNSRARSRIQSFIQHIHFRRRFSGVQILLLGIVLSTLIFTFLVAIQSVPVLDDPLTVWLFLGRQISSTHTIPTYTGNAADISWSGNYPPMSGFIAASEFLISGNTFPGLYSLVPWMYGSLSALATYRLVRGLGGGKTSACLGAFLLIASTLFTVQMLGWGYTDTLDVFYTTTFLVFALESDTPSFTSQFVAVAALSGALLCKYTELIFAGPALIFWIYLSFSHTRWNSPLPTLYRSMLALSPLVLGLSWYVRNMVVVGDPVYPFLNQVFPAKGITPAIFHLVPKNTFELSSLFVSPSSVGLMSNGNMWPFLVFGISGSLLLLATKGVQARVRCLSVLILITTAGVLAYLLIFGGFERYLIFLLAPGAAIGGIVYEYYSRATLRWPALRPCRRIKSSASSVNVGLIILASALILSSPMVVLIPAITSIPTTAIQLDQETWSYLNSLPPGLVATNDLRLFYIHRPTVNFYNIVGLFSDKNVTSTMETLAHANVTYILFVERFDADVIFSHTYLWQVLNNTSLSVLIYDPQPFTPGEVPSIAIYQLAPTFATDLNCRPLALHSAIFRATWVG